ncbi:hypothetical protein ABRQ07_01030 [Pectobacterium polonicum]|uniref:Uncharacterized protein n=1 Tax=Pectobacterium polonicum TaxID=2485124 RepID=A0ABV1P4X8_9GAMM|nr:hypothetical protein [Pectobacterium polonicum]MDC9818040.1 hypothetical protein [Pectobacterium polonicum]
MLTQDATDYLQADTVPIEPIPIIPNDPTPRPLPNPPPTGPEHEPVTEPPQNK